jgi:DNA topoisomerase-1
VPEEYWSIEAELAKKAATASEADASLAFRAHLSKIDAQTVDKMAVKNKAEADKITNDLDKAVYAVANVEKKQVRRNAPRPFTTSLLQQTANRWLGFSAKQTMTVAQQLYEQGFITYMRTDSQFMSEKFLKDAHDYLLSKYGKEYALAKPRRFKTKSKNTQEAHEAVRPTEAARTPESVKDGLERNQYKLYKLIWQRSVASQMPEAVFDATAIDIDAVGTVYQFRATGQTLTFDGFLKVYPEKASEIELPRVGQGDALDLLKLYKEEHFTKPPARYSDAGLVKALERYGIGRPSTYAPTIATVIARNYVVRDEGKKLAPTDIAFVVVDLLVAHFSHIIDYEFTAKMENELDLVADGEKNWRPVIRDFYTPFHANLEEKTKELKKSDIMPEEKSDVKCDKCGAPMVVKTGRYGKFLACSAFPNCRNIKGMNGNGGPAEDDPRLKELQAKHADEKCEKCGAPMAVKTGRYGPFLACTAYPKCKNIKNINGGGSNESIGVKCPACGQGNIVMKRGRRGPFYACDRYPDCKTAFSSKPTGQKCPDCGSPLVETKGGVKCSNRECGYKG